MGHTFDIAVIEGDGIGPEVTAAAVRVLTATGIEFDWQTEVAGASAVGEHGTALPPRVLESVRRNKVALKGPTETPVGTGHRSVNVALRKELDLYANLRPLRSLPGVKSRYEDVAVVVVRENTEDLYTALAPARPAGPGRHAGRAGPRVEIYRSEAWGGRR